MTRVPPDDERALRKPPEDPETPEVPGAPDGPRAPAPSGAPGAPGRADSPERTDASGPPDSPETDDAWNTFVSGARAAPEEPHQDGDSGSDQSESDRLKIVHFGEQPDLPETTGERKNKGGDPEHEETEELEIVRDTIDQFALKESPEVSRLRRPPPAQPAREASAALPPLPFAGVARTPEARGPEDEARADPGPGAPGAGPSPAPPAEEPHGPLGVDWDEELRAPSSEPGEPPVSAPGAKERPRPASRPQPPPGSRRAAISAAVLLLAATVLALRRVEPVHTWYYVFAWYALLPAVNHLTALRSRKHSLFLGRWRVLAHVLAWSIPVWLVFEVANLRLENWYYVGVPRGLLARRLGVLLSFATVLPGILLVEELLAARRLFARTRWPALPWKPRLDRILVGTGLGWTVLVLAWPRWFFPLLWGVPVLLLEPWLRTGGPSLLRDLTEGRPGRLLRLLAAGMACGLYWEAANAFAGGRWIYTVPGFETLKLFEMPLFGFVGFPPFALSCWCLARALVRLGLLPDWEIGTEEEERHTDASAPAGPGPGGLSSRIRRAVVALTVIFTFATLAAMDRETVDSFRPRVEDVPGLPDGVAEYAHLQGVDDVRGLLRLIRSGKLYIPGASSEAARELLRDRCRLILLRGIGTANARRLDQVGIRTIEELALWDRESLVVALAALGEPGWKPRPRRVEVWIRAARQSSFTDEGTGRA